MNDEQAIEQRISRRSFLKTPIKPAVRKTLQMWIERVNAESGLNVCLLEDGGAAFAGGKSYGMFHGVQVLLVLKGDNALPHLKEKVGYYGERLILEATKLGLGSCWVGGTFSRASGADWAPAGEETVCVIPVGNVKESESLKESFLRHMARRNTKSVEELLETDVAPDEALLCAMKLVQRAPTARNSQKVRFAVRGGVITASVPDDYLFDLVDLGICKLHFECGMTGRFVWGNGARLER